MADISRTELSTLIEEAYSKELLDAARTNSVCLQAFNTVDMGTKTVNMPVMATLPEAGFVSESATASEGVKPTAQATWTNKQLVAEEIAVIIPVHENVIDDATEDVLADLAQKGGDAIGRKLDDAVLFGTDKPTSWTSDDLHASAVANSLTHTVSGTAGSVDDLGGSIFQAAQSVDEAGWDPGALIAPRGLRYQLANIRNADGTPIFLPSLSSSAPGETDMVQGLASYWVTGRIWDTDVTALVVDPDRVIIGVRQDVQVKLLDQATVGSINLAERDMVALRFKARYAYVLGDNANSEGAADNGPVAALLPASS